MPLLMLVMAATPPLAAPVCTVADRPVARRLADLPPTVRAGLPKALAEPGASFRRTDFVGPGEQALPTARLVCGYPTSDGYVVEREQGGRGYSVGLVRFRTIATGFERVDGQR